MFNNPAKIDYSLEEGTVTEVDVLRKLCKVKTLSGQNLGSVHWLQPKGGSTRGDDSSTPELGDRCVISSGLGYPLIIGYLPRLQTMDNAFPVNVDQDQELVDTGDFSTASGSVSFSQNSPKDRAVGDRIFTSVGGGLLGLLRGGSVLIRSSRLAEIFVSKWDDVVRIVSRNFEHYTDVASDFIRNLGGRVYRYTGYAKTQKDAKTENYLYNEYYGDVAIGEVAKTNLDSTATPAADDRIYKEEIVTGASSSDVQLMHREIHTDGKHELKIWSTDRSTAATTTHINHMVQQSVTSSLLGSGLNTLHTQSDGLISLSSTTTPSSSSSTLAMSPNYWQGSFNSGSYANNFTLDIGQVTAAYKSNTVVVTLTDNGFKATFGSGTVEITSSEVHCLFGSHFVKVTAGGVQLG